MQIKKNIKYLLVLSIVLIITLTSNISNATDLKNIDNAECTKQYKIWSSLSEEERAKYIQPIAYPVKFDPAYLSGNNSGSIAQVGAILPSKYNLNDKISISVKNQGRTMECWAFSMMTALESNIALRTGRVAEKFSERHLDYATSRTFLDGQNNKGYAREPGEGGNFYVALGYATNGTGIVKNSDMPFEDSEEKINLASINKNPVVKVNNAKSFTTLTKYKDPNTSKTVVTDGAKLVYTDEQVEAVRNNIKKYIMENGAVAAFTYANEAEYYNNPSSIVTSTAYYCDSSKAIPDHAVTIVGWDDNYSVNNFNPNHRPNNPGAYLVLNSYGKNVMDNGYYYISYEDALIESSVVGISDSEEISYDNIYQHDFYGYNNEYSLLGLPALFAANVFTRSTSQTEELREVVICTPVTTNIEVYVNPNGDSINIDEMQKADISETVLYDTYNTIKLNTPIELTGEKFAIVVKYKVTDGAATIGLELNYKTVLGTSSVFDYVTSNPGEGFISLDGREWLDFSQIYQDTSICIKGITTIKNGSSNQVNSNNPTTNVKDNVPTTTISADKVDKDSTTSKMILPNTGIIKFGVIIISLVAIVVVSYYKVRKYRDIK